MPAERLLPLVGHFVELQTSESGRVSRSFFHRHEDTLSQAAAHQRERVTRALKEGLYDSPLMAVGQR